MARNGRGRGRRRKPRAAAVRRARIAAAMAAHRRVVSASALMAVPVGTAIGIALASAAGSPAPAAPAARAVHAVRRAHVAVSGVTELATLLSAAPGSATPGGPAVGTVPVSWYGYPSVLPVIGTRPGWLDVRLAQRPDGSTAWIPAADARLSSTPYRIVISLADTRLALYKQGREVFSAPAGVGTATDPTPTGQYFVAFTEPPPHPNPGYGPFILVTSDHSKEIGDWEGSGDAVIGIHGPLGESLEIGTTGARISHGCIRLQVADQVKLTGIPAGTPITITG